MLNHEEIAEIREHLELSQNPLFFFDNDVDGLASFLLLARGFKKGKGVAIKTGELDKSYLRKVEELSPDYIFILDKPLVSREFIDETRKKNISIVWIDHHDIVQNHEGTYYYNPAVKKRGIEPVTYLAYQITKNDLWLAMAGCVSDHYFPEFASKFAEDYPELLEKNFKTAFQILYEAEIGKIARILDFALKDKTSSVLKVIRFLLKVTSPNEISIDNPIFSRFEQIDKKYQALIEKAKKHVGEKFIFFQYAWDLSLSSNIANEMSYRFPGRTIVVAYIKSNRANISIRGKKAREITLKAISGLNNAVGGGHEEATGAKIDVADLPEFKRRIEELVN